MLCYTAISSSFFFILTYLSMTPHPFDQLTLGELEIAVSIIKSYHAGKLVHIKTVESEEPPKALMIPYLEAEKAGKFAVPPPRVCHAIYYILEEKRAAELWINLDQQKVIRYAQLKKGHHPPIDRWETWEAQAATFDHPLVADAIKKCGLQDKIECLTIDGWMYGCEEEGDVPRLMQMLVYCRNLNTNHPDSNMYAFPVPFVPVFDVLEQKFVRIDWCASGGDEDDEKGINYNTREEGKNILEGVEGCEYHPDLLDSLRTDLKPYNVIQPEGASFTVEGNLIKWQKWRFRVGFTPREGMVLQDLSFDGRSTFY